jgi:hypothetical protein
MNKYFSACPLPGISGTKWHSKKNNHISVRAWRPCCPLSFWIVFFPVWLVVVILYEAQAVLLSRRLGVSRTALSPMLAEADRPIDAVLGEPFEIVASEPRTSLARREKKSRRRGAKARAALTMA